MNLLTFGMRVIKMLIDSPVNKSVVFLRCTASSHEMSAEDHTTTEAPVKHTLEKSLDEFNLGSLRHVCSWSECQIITNIC
jgi:hypothetical protein